MKTTNPSHNANLETNTSRIIALGLLAILLVLAATAGKGEPAASTNANPGLAGVYTLVSVDGKSVPCSVAHEGATLTVKSGAFTINADGTCHSLSVFSMPPNPDIRRDVDATYTLQGTNMIMHWKRAGTTTGQVSGSEFTMNNEGMIFCYRK